MTTYETDVNGKYIPATQRPDGTWRKARRVKNGYTPQEEVPVYQSKAKQLQAAQKPTGIPVGMCPLVAQAEKERQLKKQKQKEKEQQLQQQKPKANPTPGLLNITSKFEPVKKPKNSPKTNLAEDSGKAAQSQIANSKSENNQINSQANELAEKIDDLKIDERQEISKKLKKLRKKLREIEDIEARVKSGDLPKPEKDQMDKVGKKDEILYEIQELEEARKGLKQ